MSDGQSWITIGTTVAIGAPARPLPVELMRSLAHAVYSINEIAFAYVPLLYIAGQIDPPQQVLYAALKHGDVLDDALIQRVSQSIAANWPRERSIDVICVPYDHEWMSAVIRTGSVLMIKDNTLHEAALKGTEH